MFFILILASGYWCYNNYGQNLPVHTTLSHVDGRTIDVVILSRSKSQVVFKRQSDPRRLSGDIRNLSLLSKCKVYWYFRNGVRSAKGGSQIAGDGSLGDLHLIGIREQMDDLAEDLMLAELRLNAAETKAQERTIENEIEALELKTEKLKYKQADYLSHR